MVKRQCGRIISSLYIPHTTFYKSTRWDFLHFFFQRKSIANLNRPEEPSPVTDKNWIVINLILLSINSYILRINSLKTNLTETAELVPSVFQRCYIGKREGRGDEVSANVTARKPQGTAWKKWLTIIVRIVWVIRQGCRWWLANMGWTLPVVKKNKDEHHGGKSNNKSWHLWTWLQVSNL